MNGRESAFNREENMVGGGDSDDLKRAKDAYVAGYGLAHNYGPHSTEFDAAFSAFEAAHAALTDLEADAFHSWQQTHVVAQNLDTGDLEAVDSSSIKRSPDQVLDPDVALWFREVEAGKRVPQILQSVPLRSIRSNPFVLELDEGLVSRMVASFRRGEMAAWLVVASLPDGTFIDVDSPYVCEALKHEAREVVKVSVLGSFGVGKCATLGLMPWTRKQA